MVIIMAASALEIVSLDMSKKQLGIPSSDTSQDDYITGLIQASIEFIERHTGRTLIDKPTFESFYVNNKYKPVTLLPDGIIFNDDESVTDSQVDITYVDENREKQTLSVFATRGIATTAYGHEIKLYPPDEGWPYGADRTPFGTTYYARFNLKGLSAADVPATMKTAALLIIDTLYHGSSLDAIPEINAVSMLLKSHKKVVI